MSNFVFTPVLWWPWLVLLTALVIAVTGWSFFYGLRSTRRIAVLWTLRTVALAGLLLVLLLPQRRHEEVTVLRPQLAVVVDTSESMMDPVDEQQPRRAERVREFFQSPTMAAARQNFDLRVFTFDQQLVEASQDVGGLSFKGDRSNLLGALRQVEERFRGQPLAAMLVLSDGLDTVAGVKTLEGVAASVPVFTFEFEKTFKPKAKTKSVSIANVDYPQRVVIGWESEIHVLVGGSGMIGETVGVQLWRDGQKFRETTVAFGEEEQTREATFSVFHEKAGVVQYEIHVTDPGADKEAQAHPFLIQVLEPGNRVLYVQNALGFDFKYLRQALVGDRNLQLITYVRWADNQLVLMSGQERFSQKKTLEFSQAELAKYSVILLGDLPPAVLATADWQALHDFVDRGGALVLLGGANSLGTAALAQTPLGSLLPVKLGAATEYREGKFPVEITESGLHHPVFGQLFAKISDLPPLLTCDLADGVAPMAEVLVNANVGGMKFPLVVARRFGQGRVVAVMTDSIWRWRLAAKSWVAERSPYDTFWVQLMDWLIPKEQQNRQEDNRLELVSDRSNYLTGEKPELRAILTQSSVDANRPATVALHLRTPDDKTFEYVLQPAMLPTSDGQQVPGYRAVVDLYVPGIYKASATVEIGGTNVEAQTKFVVTQPVTEITGKPINRELLIRLAETSRGKFLSLDTWNDWGKSLHVEEQHFSRTQLLDLWNNPFLLGFLMLMLAGDWIVRKFWNLP
ncbi:MAG: glutamine amidotransferase [Verrucomicrobiota bacterium]